MAEVKVIINKEDEQKEMNDVKDFIKHLDKKQQLMLTGFLTGLKFLAKE